MPRPLLLLALVFATALAAPAALAQPCHGGGMERHADASAPPEAPTLDALASTVAADGIHGCCPLDGARMVCCPPTAPYAPEAALQRAVGAAVLHEADGEPPVARRPTRTYPAGHTALRAPPLTASAGPRGPPIG